MRLVAAASLAAAVLAWQPSLAAEPLDETVARGLAVFEASGGCSCHTNFAEDGPALAGGRPMTTPFGVYYSTNITSDMETGIGGWSDADFARAMREGVAPDGTSYFPVFPYTAFTGMSNDDVNALRAYLFSLPAVRRENLPPEAWPPFSSRLSASAWQWMNFEPKRFALDPSRSEAWNRGAYLVNAVAHCGECHTPRNLAGALDTTRWLAGTSDGPEGELAPNLTPHETGISGWSAADVVWYLQMGLDPDGDDAQGLMREVIDHGYQNLPRADLEAIATYLATVPPIENRLLRDEGAER